MITFAPIKKNSIISTMENGKLINENNIDKIRKTFSKNQSEIIKIYKKKKKKKNISSKKIIIFNNWSKKRSFCPGNESKED